MRTLFLLPVLLVIVLQIAIHVEIPEKWPDKRWTMQLVDSNGAVLSLQDESDRSTDPKLKPGKYVVQQVFPGIKDFAANLVANPLSYGGGLMINVSAEDDGPMMLVDEVDGKVVRTFIGGRGGTRVKPGRYSLIAMTDKQVTQFEELKAKESKEYYRMFEEMRGRVGPLNN